MKHIYRRDKSWYYQFTVRGKRFQGSIGEVSKAVAREVAEKKRVEALEGRLVERPLKAPFLGQRDATTGQFGSAAGAFLTYYKENHKPSSTKRFGDCLVKLCAEFGGKRLDEIHPFLIERYKNRRKEEGFADATVNHDLRCLKHLYNMGIKWGWVRDNPVRQVKLFRENNARLRFLTLEEETELLRHCDQQLRAFVLAAVDTGFRAGELMALRWQGVDFQRSNVSVASGYTKNGDPRTNPMTRRLAEVLREWKIASKGRGDGFVFGEWRYREPFERARDAAGLSKDLCFHSLRHAYISRLLMAGADVRSVQELAGHKTITMTMRYAHLAPQHKRRVVGLLESEIAAGVTANLTTVDFGLVQKSVASHGG